MSEGSPLARIRHEPLPHWVGVVVAVGAGVGLASVHWLGLVAGGALVGLVATSFRRALMAGLGFGLVVLLAWGVRLYLEGSLGAVLATGEFVAIAAVIGILSPLLGSLLRGII